MTSEVLSTDGGPAFPAEGGCDSGLHPNPGMTLRDYFAAQAISAMEINNDGDYSKHDHERGHPNLEAEWRAKAAYRIADAMLKAREAKNV